MIELKNRDALEFSFPEVHREAKLTINFLRTFRIPDDGKTYPLPPGLGTFPLKHVDDHRQTVPESWLRHGGVMLPMYQSEALWISFRPNHVNMRGAYPFAIKVAAGKIDAVSGQAWDPALQRTPQQNYVVAPTQPWLDGFCVEKGVIRQFVAMPLGSGYSVEEQVTGRADVGGLQILVYPMKGEVFDRRFPLQQPRRQMVFGSLQRKCEMGLAPGGKMRQQIYNDPYDPSDWAPSSSRCFVHLANSLSWREITGSNPPYPPTTAKEYQGYGLPWFDYYDEKHSAVEGSKLLSETKSVAEMAGEKGDVPLPDNSSVVVKQVVHLSPGQVREGDF